MIREVLIILLLCLSLTAEAQQDITGIWKVNAVKSLQRSDIAMKTKYDSLPAEVKLRIKSSFDNREFNIKPDNTITIRWQDNNVPKEVGGKWIYDAGKKIFQIILDDGVKKHYGVTELKATHLVLKLEDTGGIFQQLYFTR